MAIGLGSLALLAVACSGGVSQSDHDAVKDQLTASQSQVSKLQTDVTSRDAAVTKAQAEITSLQNQLKDAAPAVVIQAGNLQPAPPAAVVSNWDTEYSLKAKVKLLATYDSTGPAAWDPAQHPDVFITSEGRGYAGFVSKVYKQAGFQIVDAKTKAVVASAGFDLGYETMGTPHGLGVSPDGKWIYVPTADGEQPWAIKPNGGRILVVDARTLKLAQVIQTPKGPHHIKAFTDFKGRDRVIVETQGAHTLLLDPKDNNRVVFAMGAEDLYGYSYQANADPAGRYLYIGMHLGPRTIAPELKAVVAKIDLDNNRVTYITDVGMYPNGFAFTADGKTTYVTDSAGDRVYKIDNATNRSIGSTQVGVAGPYNITLNADETQLWVVGKGEMTYNLGGSLGLVDTKTFRAVRDYHIGGQTIDHVILNPVDPTEAWVTSSGTAETIVFDVAKRAVKARVPTANGGDTHSGAFLRYAPDFTGQLLADTSGLRGDFLVSTQKSLASAAPR